MRAWRHSCSTYVERLALFDQYNWKMSACSICLSRAGMPLFTAAENVHVA